MPITKVQGNDDSPVDLSRKRPADSEDLSSSSKKTKPNSLAPAIASETYSSSNSAVKNTLHGLVYQLKLSVIFLHRALAQGYDFRLAAEMDSAEKFDDLFFEKKNQQTQLSEYRFFQIKHRLDESIKITLSDLLVDEARKNNAFSLQKYFNSFRKIKNNPQFTGNIVDLVIVTNIQLDSDQLRNAGIVLESLPLDHFLNLNQENTGSASKCFHLKFANSHVLYQKLIESSNLYQLAKGLVSAIEQTLGLANPLFKLYHRALIDENIIDIATKKFHAHFINKEQLSSTAEKLRDIFFYEYSNKNHLPLSNIDIIKNRIKEIQLKISSGFSGANAIQLLPADEVSDSEITEFLSKFKFSVNNPNEEELSQLIVREFGRDNRLNLIDNDLFADHIQRKMLDWLKVKGPRGHEGNFLSQREGALFFDELKQKIDKLILIAPTLEYAAKIKKNGFKFKKSALNKFNKFLTETIQIFHLINAGQTTLTAAKLYQVLSESDAYRKEDSYIFIRLNKALSIKDKLINAFRSSESNHLLIIDCKQTAGLLVELLPQIEAILQTNSRKKLIFISQEADVSATRLVLTLPSRAEVDRLSFEQLEMESQEVLLSRKINFQNRELLLKNLLDAEASATVDLTDLFSHLDQSMLKLGEKLPISKSYVEAFYVPRKLQPIEFNMFSFRNKQMRDRFFVTGINRKKMLTFVYDTQIIALEDFLKDTTLTGSFILSKEPSSLDLFKKLVTSIQVLDPDVSVHWLDYERQEESVGRFLWRKTVGNLVNIRPFINLPTTSEFYSETFFISKPLAEKIVILSDIPGTGKSYFLTHLAEQFKQSNPNVWVSRINLKDCEDQLSILTNLDKNNLFDNEKKVISFLQRTLNLESNFEKSLFSYSFKRQERLLLLFDGFDELSEANQVNFIDVIKVLRHTQIKQLWITTKPHRKNMLENKLACFSFSFAPFSKSEQIEVLSRIWLTDMHQPESIIKQKAVIYANYLIDSLMASNSIHSKTLTAIPLTTNLLAHKFKASFWESIEEAILPANPVEKIAILELYEHFISSTYDTYCLEKANLFLENEAAKEIKSAAIETFDNQLETFAIHELFYPTLINERTFPSNVLSTSARLAQIGFLEVRGNKLHFIHASFTEYFVSRWLYKNYNNPLLKSLVARILKIEIGLSTSLVQQFFDMQLVKSLPLHKEVLFHDANALIRCIEMHPEQGFIDQVDAIGRTALHLAAMYGYADSILQLLNWGANSKLQDNLLGWTPQGYATQGQHWHVVNTLLEKDIHNGLILETIIDPNPHRKETLLHIAANNNLFFLTEAILKNPETDFVNRVDLNGDTALHSAARSGYGRIVNLLLNNGASFSVYNFDGLTPMDEAVEKGWLTVVQSLKNRGALIKSGSYQKNAPLILAVSAGRISIMRYLLAQGNDVFVRDFNENTALHYAALIGSDEILNELIPRYKREEKIDIINSNGQTALHLAAEEGQITVVASLLVNGANPTLKAMDGDTPIHCALLSKEGGNLNFIRRLFDHPLAIGMDNMGMHGNTFLHYAAGQGNLIVVEYLLSAGSNSLEIKNSNGLTPFLLAIGSGSLAVIEFFIAKGVNLLATDNFGETAAHYAARKGYSEILDLVLRKKPELLNKRNKSFQSPLDTAVEKNKKQIVEELIAKGASVHGQGENTPLYIACEEKTGLLVQILIEAGAEINRKGWNDNTPLMGAVIAKDPNLVRYLIEAGADITLLNKDGQNVMQIAEEEGESYLANYFAAKFQTLEAHYASVPVVRPASEPLKDLEELARLFNQLSLRPRKVNSGLCARTDSRRKRHALECEERLVDEFWYEPLSEMASASPVYRSHLFSLLNLAVLLQYPENFADSGLFTFENWLEYQQRVGELMQEGVENYSFRESKLLYAHYQASGLFFNRYAKTTLLKKLALSTTHFSGEDATSHPSLLYDNGKELVLIFYRNQRYQFYSPDINYYHFFDSATDISITELQRFVEKFFTWRRKEVSYQIFTLQESLSQDVFAALQAAPFWQSNKVISDSALLNQASQHLEGIPEEIVQELLRVNDKIPHANALHPDFLLHNNGAITLRLEVLHRYLLGLNEDQRQALFQAMQKYNWLAATMKLDNLDEHEQTLMLAYQKRVILELQRTRSITLERLSEISWKVLHEEFTNLLETDEPGLAEKLHDHLKTTHTTFSQLKDHLKVGTGQTLFFLPDLIKAANTGDPKGLLSNMGFLVADTAINTMYGQLVNKLAPSLSAGRARLLRKLPVTSPIFKALAAYSIMELKQQLKTLPPGSEQVQTVKHNLAEQYVTVGLIAAEALGFEVTPLWILLIGEQLVFSAIHFRRDNQLDISFWEAFSMSLGFKEKKLQHIFNERNLVEENFKALANFGRMPFAWIIVKIAELEQPRWVSASIDAIPSSIQQHLEGQAAGFYGYSAKKQILEDLGFRLINYYKLKYEQSQFVRGMTVSRIFPPERQEWEKKLYNAKSEDTAFNFSPIENSYQEDNFFSEKINENRIYHRVASVMRENMHLQGNSPLSIQGGLAAVYSANQTNTDSKNIFFTFDPREGNVILNFTRAGLSALTNLQQSGNTTGLEQNSPYLLVIQVKEKNYFEHLVFPKNQSNQLVVTDSSRLLGTSYYIDSCISVKTLIEDNSVSSRFYVNPCFDELTFENSTRVTAVSGYPHILTFNQINTDVSNTNNATPLYYRIHLKGHRDYLELNLNNILVRNRLDLRAKQLRMLEVQGEGSTSRVHIHSLVKVMEISTRGNLIIEDDETELRVKGIINKDVTALPYFRYVEKNSTQVYHLNVQNLTRLLDTLEFQNRGALITFRHNALQCTWKNKQRSSLPLTLYITGQLGENKGYLTLQEEGCFLKIVDANNNLLHSENTYFRDSDNIVENSPLLGVFDRGQNATGNDYRYTPATPGQNSSYPIFNAKQFYRKKAPVFAMQSKKGINIFHRFLASRRIIFNKVAYYVQDGKAFGIPGSDSRLNGGQLLHYKYGATTRPVPIYINFTLDNSVINNDWRDASLTINGAKLYNLANRTEINFSDSPHYSVKLLRESLHPFPRFSRESQSPLNRSRRQVSFQAEFLKNSAKLPLKPQIADKANSQFPNFSVDIPGNLMLFRVFNHWFKFIKPFSTPAVQKQTKSTSAAVTTTFFSLTQNFSNVSPISNIHEDRMLL